MSVKLVTEHHLEFLSLKGGCKGSSESTLVKMSNCWKSHVTALIFHFSGSEQQQYHMTLSPGEPMTSFKRFLRRNWNQIILGVALAMVCACLIVRRTGTSGHRARNYNNSRKHNQDDIAKITTSTLIFSEVKIGRAIEYSVPVEQSNSSIHHISKRHAESPGITMVLFSSWTHRDGQITKNRVYTNLISNWKSFLPTIQPLVFTGDSDVFSNVIQNEWFALPEKRNVKCAGPPLLPHMFTDTKEYLDSFLYGFSNADILFSDNLLQTIEFFRSSSELKNQTLMVIGRRTNFDFHLHPTQFIAKDEIDKIVEKREPVHKSTDYFFTTKDFPWEKVAPLSIGRPAFCRWVMSYAHKIGAIVIDATLTVSALHLTTEDGNKSSWHLAGNGVHCNEDVIESFPEKVILDLGWVECAIYETYFDSNRKVQLRKRKVRDPDCPDNYNERKKQ